MNRERGPTSSNANYEDVTSRSCLPTGAQAVLSESRAIYQKREPGPMYASLTIRQEVLTSAVNKRIQIWPALKPQCTLRIALDVGARRVSTNS